MPDTVDKSLPGATEEAPELLRLPCLHTLTLLAALVLIVAWAHWPSLSTRAISFDDDQYLLDNHLVQTPSWASVRRFFGEVRNPSIVTGYYQPLAMTSLMLDVALGGRPNHLRPFHRTSLALHLLNTLLIVILLHLLFGTWWAPAAAGLLFGVHPITIEPIAWLGERKTLLAATFVLLSLISYTRYASATSWKRTCYSLCLACYALALLSKPSSTPLPVLLLLLDYWPLRRLGRRAIIEKVPFFLIGLLSAIVTIISQRNVGAISSPHDVSPWTTFLLLCHNSIFYLRKLVWPTGMSGYYAYPEPLALSDPMVLAGMIGTCLLLGLLLVSLRYTRALLTGWLFFFAAMLPAMGVIGFTHAIAGDRHAYLPVLGLLIVVAWGLGRIWSPPRARRMVTIRMISGTLLLLLVAGEVHATRYHLRFWQNSETLYRYMLTLAPNAPAVHLNLGVALADGGRADEAIAEYRHVLQLQPDSPEAMLNLATLLSERGDSSDEAIPLLRRALQLKPSSPEASNNLGFALAQQGALEEALALYQRALELKPEYADAENNLGLAFVAKGRLEDAQMHYQRALSLNPRHMKAWSNLGVALAQQGHTDQAIDAFRRAVELQPDSSQARNNLALALTDRGSIDEAIAQYRESVHLEPRDAAVRYTLGELLLSRGRHDEALVEYREALRINPQLQPARDRLAALAGRGSPLPAK